MSKKITNFQPLLTSSRSLRISSLPSRLTQPWCSNGSRSSPHHHPSRNPLQSPPSSPPRSTSFPVASAIIIPFFHTTINDFILPVDEAQCALDLLTKARMKKLNISGGEPFLQAKCIENVFKYCKEVLKLESCSVIVTNESKSDREVVGYGRPISRHDHHQLRFVRPGDQSQS